MISETKGTPIEILKKTPIEFTIESIEGNQGYRIIFDEDLIITNGDQIEIEYDGDGYPKAVWLIAVV